MIPSPNTVVAKAAPTSSPRLKSPNRFTRSMGGNSTFTRAFLARADSPPTSPRSTPWTDRQRWAHALAPTTDDWNSKGPAAAEPPPEAAATARAATARTTAAA